MRRRAAGHECRVAAHGGALRIAIAGCGGSAQTTGSSSAGDSTSSGAQAEGPGQGQAVRLTKIGDFDAPVYVTAPSVGPDANDLFVVEQGGRIIRGRPDGSMLDLPRPLRRDQLRRRAGPALARLPSRYATTAPFYVDYTGADGNTPSCEYHVAAGPRRGRPRLGQPCSCSPPALPEPQRRQLSVRPRRLPLHRPRRRRQRAAIPATARRTRDAARQDPPDRPSTTAAPYAIPPDNPFVGAAARAARDLRLRAAQPLALLVRPADGRCGSATSARTVEEIDFVPAAGRRPTTAGRAWRAGRSSPQARTGRGRARPQYPHARGAARSPAATCFATRPAALDGRYLYGDYCNGRLRSFVARPGIPAARERQRAGPTVPNLSGFGIDLSARVYAASLDGPVYRIDPR